MTYIKDYKKKEKFIENVLVTYQRQLQDKSLEQSSTEGEGTTNPESKSRKNQVFSEKVRDFDLIPLKQEQSNILDDMFSLIEACKNKFQPDVFVVMEVIPFKETDHNRSKNKLIDEVNAALKERLASLGKNFVLLKMNDLIR